MTWQDIQLFPKEFEDNEIKKNDEFITIEEKIDRKDLICEANLDLFFKNLKQWDLLRMVFLR